MSTANTDSEEELKGKRRTFSVSDSIINEAQKNEKSEKQKMKKSKQKRNDKYCGKHESETEDAIDEASEMNIINKKLEKLGELHID
ncbi:hypothetical protein DPMN_194083 [Dreissena polymorpha]|uniref:Uncharacterized protein n=1 Tax=Dreissena polymorpha TaxID=45954 RepID=A0A9D3Y189_DREPO|nr:hypothetical protein DPMN_194083 [Dreissena polymorpha]